MKIRILKTIEGAKEAEGLTVMIDAFRAFSLECYLFAAGARRIYPVEVPRALCTRTGSPRREAL
jgi:2-phosphosulfolactate phosphatase